jgi:hypothetical protein
MTAALSPPIPDELWMLWTPWEKHTGQGNYVLAEDDIQGSNPYLVFRSQEAAEIAARWHAECDIHCFPVCVRGQGI